MSSYKLQVGPVVTGVGEVAMPSTCGIRSLTDTAEVLGRQARMRAAKADPAQTTHPAIAAMQAGAGAEHVAQAELARQVLEARVARREQTSLEKRVAAVIDRIARPR